jgi:leader peptidase (prepilin peptidase)/N-methyltransferase
VPEAIYCSLLLLIATIDLEHRLVPNVLILLGLLLAVGSSLLAHSPSLTTALAGAAAGGGLFLLVALARPNAMGAGDVKLAFLIGMLTGFPWVLQALVLSILLGGLAAALLLAFRLRGPKQYIPYAPYLAAGGIATLLYGQQIAQWYARLAGVGG